ncbi:hypothetical protein J437_LFUL014821 [Ladona fulva]|uniref:Uncharacterized protein n=1 Tax=Ladona fulva TaxID=123851 RepID=A0A8K0KU78_LADFU|nr:hypothetical protein J437_LFUL014821 [Ladona fulva]
MDRVDIGIRPLLSNLAFYLMETEEAVMKILDATLYVQHLDINPSILLAHSKMLEGQNASGIKHYNRGNQITYDIFSRGYFILVLDLTPYDSGNEDYVSLGDRGVVRIEARFNQEFKQTVTCILFAEYDATLEIDKRRNIITNFSTAIDSVQIDELLRRDRRTSKIFQGVYPSDKLSKSPVNGLYVINLDPSLLPGSHWVAIHIRDQFAEYFDSYDQHPFVAEILNFLKTFHFVTHNPIQIQSFRSDIFGEYCCLYVLSKSLGQSLQKFLDKFHHTIPHLDCRTLKLLQHNFPMEKIVVDVTFSMSGVTELAAIDLDSNRIFWGSFRRHGKFTGGGKKHQLCDPLHCDEASFEQGFISHVELLPVLEAIIEGSTALYAFSKEDCDFLGDLTSRTFISLEEELHCPPPVKSSIPTFSCLNPCHKLRNNECALRNAHALAKWLQYKRLKTEIEPLVVMLEKKEEESPPIKRKRPAGRLPRTYSNLLLQTVYYLNSVKSRSVCIGLEPARDFEAVVKFKETNNKIVIIPKSDWTPIATQKQLTPIIEKL